LAPDGTVVAGASPVANDANHTGAGPLAYSGDLPQSSTDCAFQPNFESTDVATVAKAILYDILKTNYIVDPRVTGQISLTSSHTIPCSRLIPLFESALLAVNAVIVKQDGGYRIAPAADSGGLHNVDYHAAGEGFGTTVIAAKNVPAAMIAHLLEGYGSRAGTVKVEAAPNFVIVQGTAAERQAALDAASMVDVDWLRSKSVAILPLNNSSPDTIISEVNRILGTGEGGLSQDVVQMQPVNRLNAVLAVSHNRAAIDKVTRWVAKLDKADYGSLGVKVYKLQYANAKAVAALLNDAFGGSGKTTGQDDKDLLQPGGQSNATAGAGGLPGSGSSSGFGSGSGTGIGGGGFGSNPGSSGGSNTGFGGQSNPFGGLGQTAGTGAQAGRTGTGTTDTQGGQGGGAGGGGGGAGKTTIRITADTANNSLLIFADRLAYKLIERTIHELDRAPMQVDIEVTIAEVRLNNNLQYGVQAYLNSGVLGLEYIPSGATSSSSTSTSTGTTSAGVPGTPLTPSQGLNLVIGNSANPRVVINALSAITDVKTLSNPSLVVVDGKPAIFQVGDQVPVQTNQVTSSIGAAVTTSVNYIDTGIILNILPRVNANGVVSLDVEQTISAAGATTAATVLTPTISQRRVKSTINVTDGQTVLLAGLITDSRNNGRSGIPGIDQIEFLRDILQTTTKLTNRSELIIFIKPQIIKNTFDAQQVSEEFRERLQTMQTRRGPYRP
jgi:general secretion pathway protein D